MQSKVLYWGYAKNDLVNCFLLGILRVTIGTFADDTDWSKKENLYSNNSTPTSDNSTNLS